MSGGPKIVDIRREQADPEIGYVQQLAHDEEPILDDAFEDELIDAPRMGGAGWIATSVCALLALAWLGFVGGLVWQSGGVAGQAEVAALVITATGPLSFIGVAYLLLMRTSKREARRFAATASSMRFESELLGERLADLSERIDAERKVLALQSDDLIAIGEETAQRVAEISATLRGEVETIDKHSGALKASASEARADVAVLLSSLPKAQVQTRQMVASLQEAGMGALEQAGALEAQLSSLVARGREADEVAGGAAQRLAAHLARMEGTSETAGARLEEAAGQMTGAVDAALARASEAVDAARRGMEAQGQAMLALVEQSKAILARTGAETAESLAARVGEINAQVDALGAALTAHDSSGRSLIEQLQAGLADVEARLGALDGEAADKAERLSGAITALSDNAERLSGALASGGTGAETLIARAESLLTALDASQREIDESLPAALARLDARAAESRARVDELGPQVAGLETSASAALDRLAQTEKLLDQQREALELLSATADERIGAGHAKVEELAAAIASADGQARSFADGSAAQLVEVMLRVRETASQAAERAREALERIVPDAAESLGQASDAALQRVLGERVQLQLMAINAAAAKAVKTADEATQRLAVSVLSVGEATQAIEARVAEARSDVEEANREGFARRVSLLIESLNSTAIDVTKILSNEVTDQAWAAYLKGDRGVFTRRAVRLLDAGEARELLRHYDSDPEFREQVNRYIHDFEAMLRNVLSTRDGSPLGVTILSSDMGKLYVALAQALERLRG